MGSRVQDGFFVMFLIVGAAVACGDEEASESTASRTEEVSVTNGASQPAFDITPGGFGTIPAESVLGPSATEVGASDCGDAACLVVNQVVFHPFMPESIGADGVLIDVTIENKAVARGLTYSVSEFILVDGEAFAYQPHEGAGTPPLDDSIVPMGLKSRGQILFQLPEGAQISELRWTNEEAELMVELDVPNPPDT